MFTKYLSTIVLNIHDFCIYKCNHCEHQYDFYYYEGYCPHCKLPFDLYSDPEYHKDHTYTSPWLNKYLYNKIAR